jgi:hypothetical protein
MENVDSKPSISTPEPPSKPIFGSGLKDLPQTSSSAFASSGFGSLAASSSSGFAALATSKPSVFGSGAKPQVSGFGALASSNNGPPATSTFKSGFGGSATETLASPLSSGFGNTATTGFGALGGGFGGGFGGFSGAAGPKLSSFAASGTPEMVGAEKPAKAFGAPESDEEEEEDDDESKGGAASDDDESVAVSVEDKRKQKLTRGMSRLHRHDTTKTV